MFFGLRFRLYFSDRKGISKDLFINSLQNVLSDFSLFAGRLVKDSGQLYIDCNNQGVQVREVYSDHSIFQTKSASHNPDHMKYIDLINPDNTLKQGKPGAHHQVELF